MTITGPNGESTTGFGAILSAQLTPRPEYQGEIKQVIDCITPRDGIVGFINGDPYYGPFHIHPTTGVKMVGAAHTTTPHAIIYDTPAQSRTSAVASTSSSTPITTVSSPEVQTNVSDTTTTSQTTTNTTPQTGTTDTSSQQTSGQSYTPPNNNNSGGSGSSGSGGNYSGY